MRRTKTFTETVEYNYFAPGSQITPCSSRCPLPAGEAYVVTQCSEPCYASDEATVFVEGHEYGMNAAHFRQVNDPG